MRHLYLVAIVLVVIVTRVLANGKIPTECPKYDGEYAVHIADPSDCHKFFKCNNGKKISITCPKDKKTGEIALCFNPELQVCDWPYNVTCCNDNLKSSTENTPTPTKATPTPTEKTPTPTKATPTPTENTPTPTKATPTPTEKTPTPTKATPTPTEKTPTPTKATPTPTEKTPTPSVTPVTPSMLPNGCRSKGVHRLPAPDCHKFYECNNGVKTIENCREGMYFNPEIYSCDNLANGPGCP